MKNISVFSIFVVFGVMFVCTEGRSPIPPPPPPCKYYCDIPNRFGHYECCDDKRGQCPPPRDTCTQAFAQKGPPNRCLQDNECSSPVEKCCYDSCLYHKTCKPIVIG